MPRAKNQLIEPTATAALDSDSFSGASGGDPHGGDLNHRRQAALVALGRRAVAPPDVALLVQDAAALIAETLETDHYGAAELNAAGDKLILRLAATDSGGAGRDRFIENQSKFEKHASLAAYALKTAQIVVVPDLTADPPVHDRFLWDRAIKSALVVPLQMFDQAYGALGAFSRRPRDFSPADMLFAETIAHLVTTTISRERTQKALDDERRFTKTVLATVDALVLVLDPSGRIQSINSACERATGFALAELAGRPVWNTLLVHDEVASFQAMIERVGGTSKPVDLENFVLGKSGERRRVRWNFATTRSAAGAVEAIIGTGIDITDQRLIEEKLDQLEAAALALTAASPPDPGPFRPLPAGLHGERRSRPRRAFKFLQRIAPIVDGRLPGRRQFQAVNCHDISSGGFSFISTTLPSHTAYVVALGIPPVLIYLTAKVIHVTAIIRDDKPRYVVGCQYVGRANYADKSGGPTG
jgi:PAS domain S-box-containing protein